MKLTKQEAALAKESLGRPVIALDATPADVAAEAARWRAIMRKARKAWRRYDEDARKMHQAMERARAALAACVNHPRYKGSRGGGDGA